MKRNNITLNLVKTFFMLAIFILLGSCKKDSSAPGANEVYIENMNFSPSTITVTVNTTVIWTNKDGMAHTVTSVTDLFDSGSIADGKSFEHTFSTEGTYHYKCSFHSSMTGTVVVNSANSDYK